MKKTTLLLLALLAAPQMGAAQESGAMTARALVGGCDAMIAMEDGQDEPPGWPKEKVLESLIGAGVCKGYINGFIGGSDFSAFEATGPNIKKFCIPKGVTTTQMARILSGRLKKNPEFEHVDAYSFVIGVLMSTWPCQAQVGKGQQ